MDIEPLTSVEKNQLKEMVSNANAPINLALTIKVCNNYCQAVDGQGAIKHLGFIPHATVQ